MRPEQPYVEARSVRVDFEDIIDVDTDWEQLATYLDAAGINTVDLDAGRVEFTAFDWPGHREAAAKPGTDHVAVGANAVHQAANGGQRQVNLVVDALVPDWISSDPSIAGVDAEGQSSQYVASASQLTEGEVGDLLVEFVTTLGERYDPNQISVTDLIFDGHTFGDDDLLLYRDMTGASDWPRLAGGAIEETSPELALWRSQVLADLLGRMRAALDDVNDGTGERIRLAFDARVNWESPPDGRPEDGGDYEVLLQAADHLILWAYPGTVGRPAADIESLIAGLEQAGLDMTRITVSVGLWEGDENAIPQRAITPEELGVAVSSAETHGVTSVGVNPVRLMSDDHWSALTSAWGPAPTTSTATTGD
jgi:hypothetical protein